jgi:hypothetical protein
MLDVLQRIETHWPANAVLVLFLDDSFDLFLVQFQLRDDFLCLLVLEPKLGSVLLLVLIQVLKFLAF